MQKTVNDLKFLSHGGDMGELIRSINWADTSLGSPDVWPISLRISVSIMLSSTFPMYIAWGQDYIQLYNDGYRPILGSTKHPAAMGISTRQTFSEIWHIIGPMFEGVMQGNAVGFPNFKLPLDRNGYVEECFFDFSYSPIRYEDGSVGGILVTVVETTDKINALKILEEKVAAIAESEERFRTMAENSSILIAVADETSNATYFSKAWIDLTGRSMSELLDFGWVDLLHPEDRERYVNSYLDAFKEQIFFTGEFRILSTDGEYHWILTNGSPRFRPDGGFAGYISSSTDITEQLAIREQLKDSEEKLLLLADNISQLIWMTDETGYIFWYNKRWYEYTGTTLEEMQGWGWEKVQHPDHLDLVKTKWTENVESGEIFEMTFPLRSKSGEFRWFLTRAVPLRDESGKIIRWLGTNTDITEQRQNELRKNDFIGMVSHELKTPLTSLTALIQVAKMKLEKSDDAFLANAMTRADTQAKKMTTMINGFLNISRLESGKMVIDKRIFNMENLIEEIIKETKITVSSHEIIFEPCQPMILNADRDKISSVISNLIGNAVKYSPKGKEIIVKCEIVDNNVQVSIKDYGLGIKSDDQHKLFDRYYRVENLNTKHISGFGIGLYLSAEIVQRHDGQIWVESNIGEGSTFYFSLALAK